MNSRWLLVLLFVYLGAAQTDPAVLSAYQSFYNSTRGSHWLNHTGWDNDNNVCNFFGVTCSPAGVVAISLSGNNLTGFIDPTWFAAIANVSALDLSLNQLQGSLPTEINQLTSLKSLDISDNRFQSICNISSLRLSSLDVANNAFYNATFDSVAPLLPSSLFSLNISFCHLTGQMDALSSLKNLRKLDASNNYATAFFSDASSLSFLAFLNFSRNAAPGNLTALSFNIYLQVIDLGGNRIVGNLHYLERLVSIQFIRCSSNLIDGIIPNFVGNLQNLTVFDMASNQLSGPLPDNIAIHQKLQVLVLPFNLLGGPLPYYWNASSLLILSLGTCQFNGTIPPSMFQLKSMIVFVTGANRLTGELPSDLSSLSSLQEFYVSSNFHTGPLPQIWPPRTRIVEIDYNSFSGSIPDSMCNLFILSSIIATSNNLSSNLPQCMGRLQRLTSLKLGFNSFSGNVHSLANLSSLTTLTLTNNNFTGDLSTVFSLPSLQVVDLSSNGFSGVIPSTVEKLKGLTQLNLNDNKLTGRIPTAQLGSIPLQKLILSNNELTGYVPCFGSSLAYLDVSHNDLTSMDVRCYESNYQLTYLDISYNRISSTMPFGSATKKLQTLKISNNLIYGWLVTGANFRDYLLGLEYLDVSNNLLSGSVSFGLSQCKELTYVNLSRNSFSEGSLPEMWSSNLQQISVKGNRLDGTIPSNLCSLTSLNLLDLSDNSFTDQIPADIAYAFSLSYLDLSNNRLNGRITALSGLTNLNHIDLGSNQFEGQVPPLRSNPQMIDVSNNRLSGSITFINSLDALRVLDLHNNSFSGSVSLLSKNAKLISLDLSHNLFNGSLDVGLSSQIVHVNVSHNNMTGSISIGSTSLQTIDASYNSFTIVDSLDVYPTTTTCDLSTNNHIECPLPWSVLSRCNVPRCIVSNSTTATVVFHMEGQVSSFDRIKFLASIAAITNSSSNRFRIDDVKSGSVIAQVSISPPSSDAINEGSPMRVAQQLTTLSQTSRDVFSTEGIDLIDDITAPAPQSSNSDGKISSGAIIGIAVGCTVLLVLVIVISAIIIQQRNKTRLHRNSLIAIDLSQINLGAAKKSIVDHTELKDLNMIGSGAFGVVFKAKWRDISVAVKQIKAEYITEEQLKAFLSEVAILQGLRSHPNVVLFMGVTFPPQPLSMITEFCGGGSLFDYLRKNQVNWETKLKFIQGIAVGMLHLHMEKVIHRDLAVRNILLTEHLVPKVADFGMSREQQTEDAGTTQSLVGPLKWMSPEAIQKSEYSTKSDVFSFAVTVWEIITVQDPWPGMSGVDAAIAVTLGDRMPIPEGVEPGMADLIEQCWQAEPDRRPNFKNIAQMLSCNTEKEAASDEVQVFQRSTSDESDISQAAPEYEPLSQNTNYTTPLGQV
ncbi:hypothetical protein PROFUN_14031 [Planoprotostelium fungivorum]|uniref:Protein kinase domain-containing protein n=1 Tax=Planoprotostelium fungivorum TaxID=1890364 RepID=A0A2P6N272_9EUKA|nr:hypothetical protein PROFUN_14031 [Planoprotostelium fungivorum]